MTSRRRGRIAVTDRGLAMFDKFHEECGVFGIYGHAEAAKLAYLGLYALQHRGQESAGIAVVRRRTGARRCARWATSPTSSRSRRSPSCRGTSPSATRGTRRPARARSPTRSRCSSTACTARSASATTATSSTPREIRDELVRQGSIFQTNSDTEVVLHLYRAVAGRRRRRRPRRVDRAGSTGAFSLALHHQGPSGRRRATRTGSGPWRWGGSATAGSCLLRDLRDGPDRRDLRARRRARRGGDHRARRTAVGQAVPAARRAVALHLRARLLRPAGQRGVRPERQRGAHRSWAASWRGKPACRPTSSCRFRTPASAPRSATPKQSGMPLRIGLIRNHYVGRTFIEPPQSIRHFGVKVKLNPVRSMLRGPARRPDRRLDRARHDQPEDRQDGARRRRARSARAHQLPADDLALLLRRRHAAARAS